MRDFEGQVVMVTGGSSGLGAAASVESARRAKVAVAGWRKEQSEGVVRKIAEAGGGRIFCANGCDQER